ncbi:hypothetical protein PR048_007562 [Dryococelus australis]|uniref:Reverse transcriptase domain-containing protein n=1 Tax=Dryococelus australis TaxID=614101 RepID=A0ABQ9HUK4_9NEOP|nr:hypothetical protein PR048_007562 [Dryococelus australis]
MDTQQITADDIEMQTNHSVCYEYQFASPNKFSQLPDSDGSDDINTNEQLNTKQRGISPHRSYQERYHQRNTDNNRSYPQHILQHIKQKFIIRNIMDDFCKIFEFLLLDRYLLAIKTDSRKCNITTLVPFNVITEKTTNKVTTTDISFQFFIRIENQLSSPHHAAADAPQGSLLSPLLFKLYIRHMPTTPHSIISLHAYDMPILATSNEKEEFSYKIPSSLNTIDSFTSRAIFLNTEKTQSIYFSQLNLDTPPPSLHLKGTTVPWQTQTKYLGILLDSKLRFKQHIKQAAGRATGAIRELTPLLSPHSQINSQSRVTLFKSFITPLLAYAGPIWDSIAAYYHRPIYTAYYRGLCVITAQPPLTHRIDLLHSTRIPTPLSIIKTMIKQFTNKLTNSRNPLIKQLSQLMPGLKPPMFCQHCILKKQDQKT